MFQRLILVFLVSSTAVFAQSAYRDPFVPYQFYEREVAAQESHDKAWGYSVMNTAQYYRGEYYLNSAPEWSVAQLAEGFRRIRDDRVLRSPNDQSFLRRPFWLYPLDGCYSRAAIAVEMLEKAGYPPPRKVFALGNLRIKTPYTQWGSASWWYHVAPVVQVRGIKYVLDPSIDSQMPLTLDQWLYRMGNPYNMRVAVCGSGTYVPKSNCYINNVGKRGHWEQDLWLEKEWSNLESLRHDPQRLLGDAPPWAPAVTVPVQASEDNDIDIISVEEIETESTEVL